ncbi:eIF-2-alpha kinase GCN2-like [Tenebrio molitor]|uniref:eIF-2-alpha kinase GCN2-like n=1 Tax=Tenebrio molitor TaxID=7067 RepID=UPI003624AC22
MFNRTVSRLFSTTSDVDSVCPAKCVTKLKRDFVVGESLGKGGFGNIYKAKRKSDNKEFAIKIIKFQSNMDDVGKFRREAETLSKFDHKNIVRYVNSWVETAQIPISEYEKFKSDTEESLTSEIRRLADQGYIYNNGEAVEDDNDFDDDESFWTDDEEEKDVEEYVENSVPVVFTDGSDEYKEVKYLFIHMELCDKRNLRNAIDENLCLEEDKLTKYFKEICEGLSYIHQNNIVHRDLKPENIFLTSNDVIKIGDFGLSKQVSLDNKMESLHNGELPSGSLTAVCGTSVYIAPELYNRKSFNIKADMYSLGVTYFEMCSRPMTHMEKSKTFPLTSQRLKTITFPGNSNKKKFLIKSLLETDNNKRPTCEQILKILNSDKYKSELKEMIRQSGKIPFQEIRMFEKGLKSNTDQKIDLTTFLLNTAVKIFELHGGRNIPMPTFLPSFSDHSDQLTTLLNTRGNPTAISNTSRIAFAYYAATKKITEMRRYSVGKIFEEGYFSPTETQECIFQSISPEPNDFVNDAEILFTGKEICDKFFPDDKNQIRFYVNHGIIFWAVLKRCQITQKSVTLFMNLMMNRPNIDIEELSSMLPSEEVKIIIHKMMKSYKIINAEKEFYDILGTRNAQLVRAFDQLKSVVENANKFGINPENIFLVPLLVNQKYPSGLIFQIIKDETCVAKGGRFENIIRRFNRKNKSRSKKSFTISAVEISFNVESILSLFQTSSLSDEITRGMDVVIFAQQKSMAIPVYRKLLDQKVRCEIKKNFALDQGPSILVRLVEEYKGIIYHVNNTPGKKILTPIYAGNLENINFSEVTSRQVSTPRLPITNPLIRSRSGDC